MACGEGPAWSLSAPGSISSARSHPEGSRGSRLSSFAGRLAVGGCRISTESAQEATLGQARRAGLAGASEPLAGWSLCTVAV